MSELSIHPFLSFLSQQSEVREGHIPQEVDTFAVSPYLDLVGMKFELESLAQKISYRLQESFQFQRVIPNYQKVVSIANIVFTVQSMFQKLITFVHIDIGKKLAREIADGQPFLQCISTLSLSLSQARRFVTPNHFSHKPARIRIDYSFFENAEQNVVVDAVEELPYIAFKCIAWLHAILTHSAKHLREYRDTFMSTLTNAARKGVLNVRRFKDRIQCSKHRMMQYSIADARFVDMSKFGILNEEICVWSMLISFGFQISMKIKYIALQFFLECEYILLHTLAAFELVPRAEECLLRDNLFKDMCVGFHV